MAGALLQGALANPLASPDVIGVTGGAGFGAMLTLLVWPSAIALLPVGALVFGVLAAAIVFVIGWSGAHGGAIGRVILAGIAISALFGAATTSLMVAYSDRVQSAVFWLAGGLSSRGLVVARGRLAVLRGRLRRWRSFLARPLDRLALGDDVAASLGGRPRLVRLLAAAAAALLAVQRRRARRPARLPRPGHPAPRAARGRDLEPPLRDPRLGARPARRC